MKTSRLQTTLGAIQKAEAHVKQLRQKAASERAAHLNELHLAFGFESRKDLIAALLALDAKRETASTPGAGRGRRPRIPPERRAAIVKAIKAGDSAPTLTKRFGVSPQSIHLIKKAAGLVKARKKKTK